MGREVTDGKCPDCGTPLKEICGAINLPRAFICPVAFEAQRRGLLGLPGKKHKVVQVWVEKGQGL